MCSSNARQSINETYQNEHTHQSPKLHASVLVTNRLGNAISNNDIDFQLQQSHIYIHTHNAVTVVVVIVAVVVYCVVWTHVVSQTIALTLKWFAFESLYA